MMTYHERTEEVSMVKAYTVAFAKIAAIVIVALVLGAEICLARPTTTLRRALSP